MVSTWQFQKVFASAALSPSPRPDSILLTPSFSLLPSCWHATGIVFLSPSVRSYFPLSWIPFTSVTHTNTFRHIWKFKCTFCLWDKHAVFFFWIWFASINIIISISIHFWFYKCRGFTFPENWVKFCWVYVSCFLYLCISWWISGLVPFPSYCE